MGTTRICFLLLLACVFQPSSGQIVNIERARLQTDSTGWLGNAGASFTLTKNTRQVFSADADVQFQYKNQRNLYLVAGNYNVLKASGSDLINSGLIHVRYNYRINSFLRWEIFTQWQRNEVLKIAYRYLAGTGPRFKLYGNEKARFYAGCLFMFESEKEYNETHREYQECRNSSYFSFTLLPSDNMEIVSTTYFQPLMTDFSDSRLMNQFLFRLKAGKYWAMKLTWTYLYDRVPVPGTPKESYSLSTGLDVDL